jgi:hypothetical protein
MLMAAIQKGRFNLNVMTMKIDLLNNMPGGYFTVLCPILKTKKT